MPQPTRSSQSPVLRRRVTCPHCWAVFSPDEVLWVSVHPDALGDPRLGADAQRRFLPTRFNPDGQALDVRGMACHSIACPRCHLTVSRAFLEMEPLFVSILGAPGSGKSYFLTSMIWHLRKTLREYLALSFGDADPVGNQILSNYEEQLFLNPRDEQLAALPKTEEDGDLYDSVRYGERDMLYPRPFVFTVQPTQSHPHRQQSPSMSRALCLYDNAGENFLPGGEKANMPGTQHLALSRALMFLFDPTQHPKFRQACRGKTADPQMGEHGWSHRQDQVLLEAANRIRRHSGMAQNEKFSRPLIVVVTKYDAWNSFTDGKRLKLEWAVTKLNNGGAALDSGRLAKTSAVVRKLLSKHAPEIVTAAESFSTDVTYIPVSALGCSPTLDNESGVLGIRPRDIRPMWAEVPMLFAMNRTTRGLIMSGQRPKTNETDEAATQLLRDDDVNEPRIWKETGS